MDNNNRSNLIVDRKEKSPSSKEAEQNCLGLCMKHKDVVSVITGILTTNDFYWEEHKVIYQVIVDLFEKGMHIDPITVGEELDRRGQLHIVAGKTYLNNLFDVALSQDEASTYAELVRESSSLRAILAEAEKTIYDIRSGNVTDAVSVIEKQTKSLHNISKRVTRGGFVTPKQMTPGIISGLEHARANKNSLLGVPTGLSDIDKAIGGLQRGEMTVVAGRTSMGKTAFVMQLALHIAIYERLPVAFYSLEMTKEQLYLRSISLLAGVDMLEMRRGRLTSEDWDKVMWAIDLVDNAPLFIDDTPGATVLEIKSKANQLQSEHGPLGLVAVDYLSLIKSSKDREKVTYEMKETIGDLKTMGKELNVPLIPIAQINRGTEGRANPRPTMGDIADSDSIPRDADQVILLYRPAYYKKKAIMSQQQQQGSGWSGQQANLVQSQPMVNSGVEEDDDDTLAEAIIDKNRNGPTGIIKLNFDAYCTRFTTRTNTNYGY